jgi:hypothetical protein
VNLFSLFLSPKKLALTARTSLLSSRFTNISTICFIASRHHNFGFLFLVAFSHSTRSNLFFHFAALFLALALLFWLWPFDVTQLFTAFCVFEDI